MVIAKVLQSAAVALICAAGIAGFGPISLAHAGERLRDHVYADSFGNLIIYSRAGYKRIVVGQGHLAEKLAARGDLANGPKVVRLYDGDGYVYRDCYRPPVFVKGRSYMYGLADGEMPMLSKCLRR